MIRARVGAYRVLGAHPLLAAVSLCALAGGATTARAQEGPAGGTYSSYIALGDSYSSGFGATTLNGDACETSNSAWPYRVEADIGNVPFVHAACSGATTQDVMAMGPLVGKAQAQPQIELLPPADQLDAATLITITIGGNDIKLDERLGKCLTGTALSDPSSLPASCLDLDQLFSDAADIIQNSLAPSLNYTFAGLRAAAPSATIVAVGYPHLVDTVNPACDQTLTGQLLDLSHRQQLNSLVDAMNAQIQISAANAGISWITDEVVAAFQGHELCSTDEWLVSPEVALATLNRGAVHPNDIGYQGYAEAVLSALPNVTTQSAAVTEESTPASGEVAPSSGEPEAPAPGDESPSTGDESGTEGEESP
jgi:lysophospholipase L1-like esterase